MNFVEAVKAMKEGKKVRRKDWGGDDYYLFSETGNIEDNYGDFQRGFPINECEATDWEIVDEEQDWNLERFNFVMLFFIIICFAIIGLVFTLIELTKSLVI